MKADALVAEIGSTTTVITAFDGLDGEAPRILAQGAAPTSVLEGDVTVGLSSALEELKVKLIRTPAADTPADFTWETFMACSSAAGGLRMTVHGLVMDMTARAAREAALGAGAVIKQVTAGKMRASDIDRLESISPNIILLAGGVDYGERETALHNARLIAALDRPVPVIYAGNVENRVEIRRIFEGTRFRLHILDNVYPRIDELNVEGARRVIQEIFEENIIHAPGMEKIREMVDGPILPSPGAVFTAAQLFRERAGELVVIDAGGATTDVHSVTAGSEEINRILVHPEPEAKRTVEGDLGVYVNRENVLRLMEGEYRGNGIRQTLPSDFADRVRNLPPVPRTNEEIQTAKLLTSAAGEAALQRHAGRVRDLYSPGGRRQIAEGKDLSRVEYFIGTGGALTRLPGGQKLLEALAGLEKRNILLPPAGCRVLLDSDYIMAAAGVLSKLHPEGAWKVLARSLGLEEDS